MEKKGFVFIFLILFLITASAQQDLTERFENLENDSVVRGVGRIQDIREQASFDYLGEEWKKILLSNEIIVKFDNAFQKLNFLFVLFFARDYSLSLEMFFVFLFWIFTFFSLVGYFEYYFARNFYQFLFSLAGTIILSWVQIINYVGKGLVELIFYPSSILWSFALLFISIIALVVYFYVNKVIAGKLKRDKKEDEIKQDLKEGKAFREGFLRGRREY